MQARETIEALKRAAHDEEMKRKQFEIEVKHLRGQAMSFEQRLRFYFWDYIHTYAVCHISLCVIVKYKTKKPKQTNQKKKKN